MHHRLYPGILGATCMNRNARCVAPSWICTLLFVMFTMIGAGCGDSANKLYEESAVLLAREETQGEGLKKLLEFEKKYPRDRRTPEVMLTAATIHRSRKDFTAAIDAFERLFVRFPDSEEAYKGRFLLGYMYYDDLNDRENTLRVLNDFVSLYPDSELTVSAQVIIENIGLPIEEWSIVKKFGLNEQPTDIEKSLEPKQ